AARDFRRAVHRNPLRRSLLLAAKAAVIAADAASSGLVREGHPIDQWIGEIVQRPDLHATDITRDILEPRTRQISRGSGRAFQYHRFQEVAAGRSDRLLLLAPCAAGKTLTAWRWAAEQSRRHPFGSVLFLYPTRATATEGFRDYVAWAPEADAALLHSSARYELEAMLQNPSEAMRDRHFLPD